MNVVWLITTAMYEAALAEVRAHHPLVTHADCDRLEYLLDLIQDYEIARGRRKTEWKTDC